MELQQLIDYLIHYFKAMFKAVGQEWTEKNSEDIRKAVSEFSNMVVLDAVNLASQKAFQATKEMLSHEKPAGEVESVPESETPKQDTDGA